MAFILSYTKKTDQYTTYQLLTPEGSTELCTIDGTTYVSVPDGETLPDHQPAQIADSIETPVMTPELLAELKAASPHAALINRRMIEKIRERYSVDDEMFFARIAGGAGLGRYEIPLSEQAELDAYQQYVEGIREWGREQRASLGLVVPDTEEPAL